MMQYKQLETMKLRNNQKGAVLIVSLMLLLVMTLLSIASMSNSVMQEKMAANAQNTNRTFQAAESSIGALVNEIRDGSRFRLSNAMTAVNFTAAETSFNTSDPDVVASSQVIYLGEVILSSGGSLNADQSSTTLRAHRYELRGVGSINAVQAQTIIRQGLELL